MAHRSTNSSNRRNLAAPEAKPLGSAPQLKRLPKPTSQLTTQSSDPLILPSKKPFFLTNQFSRLNLNHKIRTPQKPTTNNQHNRLLPPASSRDIHLQAKAMTVSADAADSSLFSLIRAKASLKEKVRKGSSKDLDKKKEQQQQHHHHYHQHRRSEPDSKKITTLAAMKEKQVNNNNNLHDMKKASGSLGRRRSFCGSQVELADILANCGVKIVSVDMPPFMQIHAVDCARKTHDSLEKFTSKTLALTLKKEFDGVYGPAWHCIVGTSFGSFVTHSVGGFLYFSMDHKLYVLLFKTTVQRAD